MSVNADFPSPPDSAKLPEDASLPELVKAYNELAAYSRVAFPRMLQQLHGVRDDVRALDAIVKKRLPPAWVAPLFVLSLIMAMLAFVVGVRVR